MSDWVVDIADEGIDAALEEARHLPPETHALSGEWNRALDVIVLHLDNGRRLVIPREDLQGLRDATPEQISDIQVFFGNDICWPQLDLNHDLQALLKGRYGNDRWMEALQRPSAAA